MNKPGLREIKKEATVHALANAAFELALERGLDGFVVDDVVQRAGYSRRTFANYFSCKEEAVVTAAVSFKEIDGVDLDAVNLPEGTTPLDALQQWMRMQLTTEMLRKMRELVSFSKRYPTLEPYILNSFHQLQKSTRKIISGYFHDRYPEQYCHTLMGAVYGAMLPILDGTIKVRLPGDPLTDETTDAATFDQYLETTFGCLRNGF